MSERERDTAEPTKPTGRERLEALEKTGEYLFHGSPSANIEEFEPRQAHDYDEQTKEAKPDGPPAVFAAPEADTAIFRALVNGAHLVDKTRGHMSRMGVVTENGQKNLHFAANKNSLDGARLPGTKGCVYVFRRSDFTRREEPGKQSEWVSFVPVSPIETITVKPADLPDDIEFLED